METSIKKIKAFPLYMGNAGCDFHRVRLPFIYAYEYFDNDAYIGFDVKRLFDFLAISEVVVINRNFPLGLPRLKELRDKHGFKVVVDLDDWFVLPDYHPNYREYKNGSAQKIIENLRFADCVTVTTERLAERVKQFNTNVHVIPNALPYGHGPFGLQPERPENEKFNFIYTGQSSHLEDVRIMQPYIKRASKLNVSFTLAGYKPHPVWNGIEKVFNQGGRYERINGKPLDTYMEVYNNADCSLVPLCMNDFNSCKSNLKLLEAAAKKMPCIVSWVPPYRDDVDAPVLWVKTPEDWYKHMKYLSENRQAAKDMGEELYQWARERFYLPDWNKVRFELYQSLIK